MSKFIDECFSIFISIPLNENIFTLKDLPAHFHLRLRILKVFVAPHLPFSNFQIPHRLELHMLRVSFWLFCLPYFFRVASGLPQVHHQVLFLQSLLHLLRHNCLSWQNWNFFNVLCFDWSKVHRNNTLFGEGLECNYLFNLKVFEN